MIDAFDAAFDQPAVQPAGRPQPAGQYEPAPPGEYVARIVKAERKRVPWKANDANPHGDCTVLRLHVGRSFGFVFVDVPDDLPWLARAVAQAVGLAGDELVPERLIDRQARVMIKNYTKRDGSRKAAVARWLPATATRDDKPTATLADAIHEWATRPPQSAQRPQRPTSKPSRNAVKRHTNDDDDIPF